MDDMTTDLFGNEVWTPTVSAEPTVLDMFDHAAERAALESGRPVSQERTEIVAPHTKGD